MCLCARACLHNYFFLAIHKTLNGYNKAWMPPFESEGNTRWWLLTPTHHDATPSAYRHKEEKKHSYRIPLHISLSLLSVLKFVREASLLASPPQHTLRLGPTQNSYTVVMEHKATSIRGSGRSSRHIRNNHINLLE